jgi:hypothetical protein
MKVNATQAATHFVNTSGATNQDALKSYISELWGGSDCRILCCERCLSRFAEPHVAGDSRFYELAFPISAYPKSRWEFDLAKKTVAKSLGKDGKLLEIGAGSGVFITQLISAGLAPSQIVVTEYSTTALSQLMALGVKVESVDFRLGVKGGPFRVIALFQTLEHLGNLDEVIIALSRLATNDAEAFISVPNVAYIDWAQENLGIIDMPPNHITAFSQEGLSALFLRQGWQTENIKLQRFDSLLSRFKNGAMRGLSYPSSTSQELLSALNKKLSPRIGKVSLILCAFFVVLTNWSLMRKLPPENIYFHASRIS